jgi:Asp-tRNA(Asn)/Glu-tRNA(Gln) amidotransferase C subunit
MSQNANMSKETFLVMAKQLGLDISDANHMEIVYQQVNEIMSVVTKLRNMDLSDYEPSNTFSSFQSYDG